MSEHGGEGGGENQEGDPSYGGGEDPTHRQEGEDPTQGHDDNDHYGTPYGGDGTSAANVFEYIMQNQQVLQHLQDSWHNQQGVSAEGTVDFQGAHNMVDELQSILNGQNVQEAKSYFTFDNPNFEEPNQEMDFEKWLGIIENYLRSLPLETQPPPIGPDHPVGSEEGGEPKNEDPQDAQFGQQTDGDNIYKHHNRMRVERFLKLHREQVQIYYNEFSKEKQGKEPLVSGGDLPLVMRIAFYMDNITFHQTKEDPQEFFEKPFAQTAIMTHLASFIEHFRLGAPGASGQPEDFKLNFTQFLAFVEFFINHEPTLFLKQGSDQDYSNDILERHADNSETDLEKEIKANIAKYELMLDQAQNEQDRIVINNMLSAFYDQYYRVQQVHSPGKGTRDVSGSAPGQDSKGPKRKLTKQELRKRNLAEIFIFYCKQQYVQSVVYTFERLIHESHVMNLSNFLLFCKHFRITNYNLKLTKKALPIFFKKNASNYRELTFEEFQSILEKIALIMYEDRNDELPTDLEKIEAFYKFIGVENPNYYRKHMHLLNPPFNIQDKEGFRLLARDVGRPIEMKKVEPRLKQELERRKREREFLLKKYMSLAPNASNKNILSNDPLSLYQANNGTPLQSQSVATLEQIRKNPPEHYVFRSYGHKAQKDQIKKLDLQNKVSWQQLGSLDQNELTRLKGGAFRPTDLFDEHEDKEDRQYLAQYSLLDDKIKKQQQQYYNRLNQESYGSLKAASRPSERYLARNDPQFVQQGGYGGANVHRGHSVEDSYDGRLLNIHSPQQQRQQLKNYSGSGVYSTKNINSQIGQNYMNRANQIDYAQRQREQAMLRQMAARQDQNVNKGLSIAAGGGSIANNNSQNYNYGGAQQRSIK